VIAGEGDSVITTVAFSSSQVALCYESEHNNVYCADWGSTVTVIDGATDSVVEVISVGAGPRAFCLNPAQSRLYVASSYSSSISVIRTSPQGVEEDGRPEVPNVVPIATVVRGMLSLDGPGMRSESPARNSVMSRAALLDVNGRAVMALRPGTNDVSVLAPGVYFVRVGRK